MIKNKKILITGGLGFIGSHLTQELLKFQNKVYLIDNFKTRRKKQVELYKKLQK